MQLGLAKALSMRALGYSGTEDYVALAQIMGDIRRAYGEALGVIDRDAQPHEWYRVTVSMAEDWGKLALSNRFLYESIELFEEALGMRLAILGYFSEESRRAP